VKQNQSGRGAIRERIAAIEAKLEVGVKQEAIIEELKAEGFEFNPQTFRNALMLARKWVAKKPGSTLGAVQNQPPKATPQESQVEPVKQAQAVKAGPNTPPALKSKGFEFRGTNNEDDLI
jgi:hypothetical protein